MKSARNLECKFSSSAAYKKSLKAVSTFCWAWSLSRAQLRLLFTYRSANKVSDKLLRHNLFLYMSM